jgi:dihydroorotate dehydrogenase
MQLYSALVYRGLGLVGEIKSELLGALARGEANSLSDFVGVNAQEIVTEPWPD